MYTFIICNKGGKKELFSMPTSCYRGPDLSVYDLEEDSPSDISPEMVRSIGRHAIGSTYIGEDVSQVKRVPNKSGGEDENDAEHSWILAVAAAEIARTHYPELDLERIWAFSLIHDVVEVKTGDVATFNLTQAEIEEKERREHEALLELYEELPVNMAEDLRQYEAQDTPEARFVRAVDKLLPLARNIASNDMSNFRDNYGIVTVEALRERHIENIRKIYKKFGEEFPEIAAAYTMLCHVLEDMFVRTTEHLAPSEVSSEPKKIQLKYLVDLSNLHDQIDISSPDIQCEDIRQAYIEINADGSATRIRSINDSTFEYTKIAPGTIEREKTTIPIQRKEVFDALLCTAIGDVIEKTRYTLTDNGTTIKLDEYHGRLKGLAVAEVEFDNLRRSDAYIKAATFKAPEWCKKDISHDPAYRNHNLTQGIPDSLYIN